MWSLPLWHLSIIHGGFKKKGLWLVDNYSPVCFKCQIIVLPSRLQKNPPNKQTKILQE